MADKKEKVMEETTELQALQLKNEALQEENEALQVENEELINKLIRGQADFDNYRKRTAQEKQDIADYVIGQFLAGYLPVWDNFERAVTTANQDPGCEGLAEGIEIVYRQFNEKLTVDGIVEIAASGEVFDPEYHQAVMQVEGGPTGMVADVIQKGYTFKEKVIRPAMVSVYK